MTTTDLIACARRRAGIGTEGLAVLLNELADRLEAATAEADAARGLERERRERASRAFGAHLEGRATT